MVLGFPERTRLSAMAPADGCINLVTSPRPMEKSCQLIMMRLALWLIVVTGVPLPPMVALPRPPTTEPPTGLAREESTDAARKMLVVQSTAIFFLIHAPDLLWRSNKKPLQLVAANNDL